MTLEKIVTPKVEITLFGKKYNCEMKIRNYAVLRERTGVREHELLKGLMDGDIKFIVYAIWASTLIFAKFDETEPIKVKKEVPMEKLFKLSLQELNVLGNQVAQAIQASLPEPSEKEKALAEKKLSVATKPKPQKKSMKKTTHFYIMQRVCICTYLKRFFGAALTEKLLICLTLTGKSTHYLKIKRKNKISLQIKN